MAWPSGSELGPRLGDRAAIQEVELRWCRAIDRRDFDAMPALFHADAHDDHGAYRGGIAGLVEWLEPRHRTIVRSVHSLSNLLVEFAGPDDALAEAYLEITQRFLPGSAAHLADANAPWRADRHVDLVCRARYIDRLQRREGEWKILRRRFVIDWKQVTEVAPSDEGAPNPQAPSQRSQDDAVHAERRAMDIAAQPHGRPRDERTDPSPR